MEEVGIRLSLAGRREAAAGLKESKDGLTDVGEAAEQAGNQAEAAEKKFSRTRSVLGFLGRGAVVAGGLVVSAGVAMGTIGLKTAANMETAKIGFTTMLGSGRKAKAFLTDLADFAAKTPFEFPELQTAASRLVSAGVETEKIIPMMTTLGDVTAGMGTGSEGISRATNALQQMIAAQRISAEDLNQLRDAGIPVYDLLASALGKTKGEIVALKDEGKLGKDALDAMMGALESGKGLERFNGLMDKQSKSLNGTWSTLKDTVNMGLAGAVKPALPLVKDLVNAATDMAEDAMPALKRGVKGAVGGLRDLMQSYKKGGIKGVLDSLRGKGSSGAGKNLAGIGDGLGKVGTALSGVDWSEFKDGLSTGVVDSLDVFSVVVGFAADHVDLLGQALPYLVGGLIAYKGAQVLANIAAGLSLPIRVLELIATRQQTKALKELVILQGAATGTTTALATTTGVQAGTTTAAAGAQRGLNAAMRANPIGAVITAVALLVGGFVLLYNKSDTFRGMVDGLWNNVLKPFGEFLGGVLLDALLGIASGMLRMGEFGIKAFKWLLKAAFATFDGILSAAEAGLGWVPGLGDKIKGAREAFSEFGDKTIAKLERVEGKLRSTREQVDALAKDRSATISITTRYTTLGSPTRGRDDEYGTPSPDVLDNRGNGGGGGGNDGPGRVAVLPVPTAPSPSTVPFKPERMPKMETRLYLDGKQIARNTARHVTKETVRR